MCLYITKPVQQTPDIQITEKAVIISHKYICMTRLEGKGWVGRTDLSKNM